MDVLGMHRIIMDESFTLVRQPTPLEVDGILVQLGFSCLCGYACISAETKRKHKCGGGRFTQSSVQQIYNRKGVEIYPVIPVFRSVQQPSEAHADASLVLSAHSHLLETTDLLAVRSASRQTNSVFLQFSGLAEFAHSRNLTKSQMQALRACTLLPSSHLDFGGLSPAITVYFDTILDKFDVTNYLVRQHLRSTEFVLQYSYTYLSPLISTSQR
jgi:hypothetical protein